MSKLVSKTKRVLKAPAKKPLRPAKKAVSKAPRSAKDAKKLTEEYLLGPDTVEKEAKKVSPDEAAAFMFLQGYLRTLSKTEAARLMLDEEQRKHPSKVYALANRMWRSPVFQRMLDEHLDEFGRKTRRLKRLTVERLQREMVADHGVGSHQARVRAVEAMMRLLGLDQPAEKKGKGTQGAGVLVVPGAISLEDWAASAEAAQEKLREKTREASGK